MLSRFDGIWKLVTRIFLCVYIDCELFPNLSSLLADIAINSRKKTPEVVVKSLHHVLYFLWTIPK